MTGPFGNDPPQRLGPLRAAAISDSGGNAVFTFPPIPSTRERWGTLTCPRAPVGAVFDFFPIVGGDPVGSWAGPNVWGPIVIVGMLTPTITATGLLPNTTYALNWHGYEGPAGSGELNERGGIYPGAAGVTQPKVSVSVFGLIAASYYHAFTPFNAPISWILDSGAFDYTFGGTGAQIARVPANSITLVLVRGLMQANMMPSAFPAVIGMEAVSTGTIDVSNWETDNDSPWAVSPTLTFLYDTASPVGPLPITIDLYASNVAGTPELRMSCYSWTHP